MKDNKYSELSDIDKMVHCIKMAAIASKDTADTRWIIEILLQNAKEIKYEGQEK